MAQSESSPWRIEAHYVVHSVAGAFLFGAPFLYTMEVWWRGNTASPARMLAALTMTFLALVVIERAANLKSGRRPPWSRTVTEAAQAQAMGLAAAMLGLALIGEVTLEGGAHVFVGRIVFEGIPFGLGVGLADFLLGEAGGRIPARPARTAAANEGTAPTPGRLAARLSAAMLGATVLGATLAPTEEIPLIAITLSEANLVILVVGSLAVSYAIVFASNVVTGEAKGEHGHGFDSPLAETVASYVVSFATAVALLWLFGQLSLDHSPRIWLTYSIVLGLPASIGGAAGRLVL